jgi:nicotinate-nucleotide adenylyltransferase
MVRVVDPTDVLQALRTSERPRLVLWPESEPAPPSVALLAGSFDPITVAHMAMARAARADAGLVVLVYAVATLPKEPGTPGPLLTERQRIRIVAEVCAAHPGLALGLCSHGLLADQVAAAGERFPGARLAVVLGSDKLVQLFDPGWYDDRDASLAALFAAAEVRYSVRDGADPAPALAEAGALGLAGRIRPLDVDPAIAAVSSREVRELVRAGGDVAGLVPPEALPAVRGALRRRGSAPTASSTGP